MDVSSPPSQQRRKGFFATWANVTFRPAAFFSLPADERSDWSPIPFALVVGAIGLSIGTFCAVLLVQGSAAKAAVAALATLVAGPVVTLVWLYVVAGLIQVFLILVRGRDKPYRETLRCLCYAHAPNLFVAMPLIGSVVALIWQLVLLSIGLKRLQSTNTGRAVFAALLPALFSVSLAVGLRMFVLEAFKIPSGAMLPTIQVGDHIFVNKMAYRFGSPSRGDVIVFKYPQDPDKDFIKRVVAVGGDTIEIRQGFLYINGQKVPREFAAPVQYEDIDDQRIEVREADEYHEMLDGKRFSIYLNHGFLSGGCPPPARFGCGESARVPDDAVYVMGDNRDNSHDSRFWGFVPNELIKGRAMFIWFSEGPHEDVRWSRVGKRVR